MHRWVTLIYIPYLPSKELKKMMRKSSPFKWRMGLRASAVRNASCSSSVEKVITGTSSTTNLSRKY